MQTCSVTVVGIAGASGAGKSWLARDLQRRLRPHAARISLDDFYRDLTALEPARRAQMNFDHPAAIDWALFETRLREITDGAAPRLPRYDFKNHTREATPRRWNRRPVVLVEGLWPWWRPRLRRLYRLRVFLDGDESLLFGRRLERDVRERRRTEESVRRQWREQVWPMSQRYVLPQARHAQVRMTAVPAEGQLARLAARIRRLAGLG